MQKPLNLTAKKIIKKRQAPQFFYKKMPTKKVKTAKKKYCLTRKKHEGICKKLRKQQAKTTKNYFIFIKNSALFIKIKKIIYITLCVFYIKNLWRCNYEN